MIIWMLELKPASGPIDLLCHAITLDLAKREAFLRAPSLASAQWHEVQGGGGAVWCQVPGKDRLIITPMPVVDK